MGRAERYGAQLWNAIFSKKAEWRSIGYRIVSIVGDTRRLLIIKTREVMTDLH